MTRADKRLLAGFPDGRSELCCFGGFGQSRTKAVKFLQDLFGTLAFDGINFVRAESSRGALYGKLSVDTFGQRTRRNFGVCVENMLVDRLPPSPLSSSTPIQPLCPA